MSSLKLLRLNCKISHLQVQDRFQIPYFSRLYGIIERKTTHIQSGCRCKQDFTKICKQDGQLSYPCLIVNQWFLACYYYLFFPTAILA